jgi:hypothetical protein
MPLHLYGVLDAGSAPAPSTAGIDGRVVRVLPLGDRSVWVSDIDEPTMDATPRRLREHDAVLSAAIRAGRSPVPARVGRVYADDIAVAAAIEAHAPELDAAMSLVRDRVEMSLLIAASNLEAREAHEVPPRDEEGAGHAHLRRIKRQLQGERNLLGEASNLAQSIARALSEVVVAERTVEDPAPPVLVARAHLIARDDTARYLDAIEKVVAAADRELRVAVRGPGAAYSFAAVQGG